MFKRWGRQQTTNEAPKFSSMERKTLMLRVGYDGMKMEEKLMQSNSMKPTGSIRPSSNQSDLTSTTPSWNHTIAATHFSLLVLNFPRQALPHSLGSGHALFLESSSLDAASFPQVFAQMSHSQ